jgi:hypothetical protein
MIKLSLKILSFLLLFPSVFILDYKFVSKSLFISLYLSILYIIYIWKFINCIFNIFEYYCYHYKLKSQSQWEKIRKYCFDIKKNIYVDSIILFIISFLIIPYIWYFYHTSKFIIFYTNLLLLFIPSITIIASA